MLKIAVLLFLSAVCPLWVSAGLCCLTLGSCFLVGYISRPGGHLIRCPSVPVHAYSFSLIAL